MCRSAEQCAERVADRENLVRELVDALGVALNAWGGWYDDSRGRNAEEDFKAFRDAKELLRRAKDQQGE